MENKKELNKYEATWLSHSSISDFLNCPRLYYLRHIYKDLKTGHKITVMSPPLALGQIVHEVVESLSVLPVEKRLDESLSKKFDKAWEKVEGEMGGFKNDSQEEEYKKRGYEMLKRIEENPGPISQKAVKIKAKDGLPYYWFSEEEEIILCGKIDWLEYLEDDDAVHIIDFKTGRIPESSDSLQLPIYLLLASNTQNRKVKKASYWYLDNSDKPEEQKLPSMEEAEEKVDKIARRIKLARKIGHFKCKNDDGCKYCYPLERVLRGHGRLVGLSEYKQDIYILE